MRNWFRKKVRFRTHPRADFFTSLSIHQATPCPITNTHPLQQRKAHQQSRRNQLKHHRVLLPTRIHINREKHTSSSTETNSSTTVSYHQHTSTSTEKSTPAVPSKPTQAPPCPIINTHPFQWRKAHQQFHRNQLKHHRVLLPTRIHFNRENHTSSSTETDSSTTVSYYQHASTSTEKSTPAVTPKPTQAPPCSMTDDTTSAYKR